MKIWVDENIPMGKEAFAAHGETVSFAGRGLKREDILQADALIVRSVTKVNAALLEGTPVKFVGTATIGTDHVDMAYLKDRGIGFSSAPGCNANSVGEYVTAALTWLELNRGFSLAGKTLGIIGWGHVGKQVERKALALGLRVLKSDPPLLAAARAAGGNPQSDYGFTDQADLLAQSDIVTLHTPLTKDGSCPTLKLANADFFARLTRPIVLFNSCRGEVIDDSALVPALDAGKVRHLVLDVFIGEPQVDQAIATRADLISPHIAGYSLQGKLNGTTMVAAAFRGFFFGSGFATAWEPVFPVPAAAEIAYRPDLSDNVFVQLCVHTAYDLPADDRRLRESFQEPDPGKAFDRQRRDYPVRHEFPSYRVTRLPAEKRDLRFRLAALGFRLD